MLSIYNCFVRYHLNDGDFSKHSISQILVKSYLLATILHTVTYLFLKKKKTNQKGSRKIATDGGMRRRKEYKKNRTQKKWKKEEVKKESGKQNLIILCWFKVFPI